MFFLDTSAIIELIYGTEKGEQIRTFVKRGPIALSALSVHELLVGLKEKEREALTHFFAEVTVFDFDKKAAEKSAEIERGLQKKGRLVNRMDILIAAACLVHDHDFLTCDKHFLTVEKLKVHLF